MPAPDLALRILKLQKFLGLPLSELQKFHELDRYGGGSNNEWVGEELSKENRQLEKEERDEELAGEEDDEWV